MKLFEFLHLSGVGQNKMAKDLDIDRSLMSRIVHRQRLPSASHIKAIHRYTKGNVGIEDFALEFPEWANAIDVVTNCKRDPKANLDDFLRN